MLLYPGLHVHSAVVDFPARQAVIVVGEQAKASSSDSTKEIIDKQGLLDAAELLIEEVESIGFEASVSHPTKQQEAKPLHVLLDVQGMRCMKNCGTPVQNVLGEADLSALGKCRNWVSMKTCRMHVCMFACDLRSLS